MTGNTDTALLEVDELTVRYETPAGQVTAVSDASFTIDEGEFHGLVGESGCGKSTMAKAIIGALDRNGSIASGKIRYRGEEVQDLPEKELSRRLRWSEISVIPQSAMDSLDPFMRIEQQATKIAKAHDRDVDEAIERFGELFELVGLDRKRMSAYPHELSGGMQQRAIIALALFLRPSVIIADEPTTALDVIMQDQVFKYLDRVKEDLDTSVLLITHDIALVFESCDTMSIMHGGQVAETGSVADVVDDPRHPYSILLQESFPDHRKPGKDLAVIEGEPPQSIGEVTRCTFANRCPWAVEECRTAAPDLEEVGSDGGQQVACIRKDEVNELFRQEKSRYTTSGTNRTARTASDGDPVLEARDLEKYFAQNDSLLDRVLGRERQDVRAVDDVTLTLRENEVVGVIGESGCGKTTLLRTLMGLYEKTGGDIVYDGTSVEEFDAADWRRFRSNVSLISQDPFNSLDPKMTVEESLGEPLEIHGIGDREERVHRVLADVELEPQDRFLDKRPDQLSGGERQRVVIGRALIQDPDVILADEPVSMLDVSTQASVLGLLSDLIDEYGASMLYISHDLSTVAQICQQVNVMYLGRIVERAGITELLEDPQHPYTRALLNAIPVPDPHHDRARTALDGSTPDPIDVGEGCRFADRCHERMDVCDRQPAFVETDGDHRCACHLHYDHETYERDRRSSETVVR